MNFNGISIGHGIVFAQAAWLLAGLFLIVIGVAVLYSILDWRIRAQHLRGEIIGVRQRDRYFHNVFRYVGTDGVSREATSLEGSTSLQHRDTGRQLAIEVMRDRPAEAREAVAPAAWAVGIGFCIGGTWLAWYALTAWAVTMLTWLAVAVVAGYAGVKIWQLFTGFRGARSATDWGALPVSRVEELPREPQAQPASAKERRTGVIFCVVGLAVLAVAYIPARELLKLRGGQQADGIVVSLHRNTANNSDPHIFPRVQFTRVDGAVVRFDDRSGSSPSRYKVGDRVAVAYQPNDASSPMIDRGLRNWIPVLMLLLLGTTFAAMGASSLRSRRKR